VHILYVSQYFPPEMGAPAARVYELSRHWVAAGHRVTVLTGFPNHPTGVVPPQYRRRLRRGTVREVVDGIEVVRTWLYPAPNRRPGERMLNYASFFVSACLRGVVLEPPDVVIATSPQLLVGLSGWWISGMKRCPFVFEVRDLWPESLLASGIGREDSPLIRSLERLASFLYRRCDRIVVVTEAFKENLIAQRGLPGEKIDVIENGVETDDFCPREVGNVLREHLDLDGKFVVSYIGTIGYAHGLEIVLEAARRLKVVLPEVLFLLVGEGAEKEKLQALVERERVTNLRFLRQQPRNAIPSFINASDVCLVLLRKAELFTTVLPSKMLEFMACGRPVVLGVDGQARRILDEAQAGIYIPPEDPAAFTQAVTDLYRNPALRSRLGENGREFILKHYSREQKAFQYLRILEGLKERERQRASNSSRSLSVSISRNKITGAFEQTVGADSISKRLFDLLLSAFGLLLSSPLWLLLALGIKLEDGGPIFYAQERVGKGGRRFKSWKFRSMVTDSDLRFGPLQATDGDPRVTRIGRSLRATALDELPQLLNIFRGEMSFVGPRALLPEEIEVNGNGEVIPLEKIPGYEERHKVSPGLTGLAQVYAPRDIPRRQKFRYDLLYIKKQSLWLDIRLVLLSVWISVRGKWEARTPKF
jgi:lipopolysaccharide/colanic/teichoic acid biosynthesis glycosyltransferase